jgi:hypothetical protein
MQAVQQVVEGLDAMHQAEFPHQHSEPPAQPQFDEFYHAGGSTTHFDNYTTTPQLPLLRIPEIPGLSYNHENSPWPKSAFESIYSTQPDGPQNIPQRASIGRSASMAQTVDKTSCRHTEQEWESQKELIHHLYITEDSTVKNVRTTLSRDWGFEAT